MVTNKEYETALNDINNIKIKNYLMKRFKKWIPNEEINRCYLIALWKTMQNYDIDKSKFTTYLYKMCVWEFSGWIKEDNEYNNKQKKINRKELLTQESNFNEIIELLPKELSTIVEQKLIYNMNYSEIAKKNKCSYSSARQKYKKAIEIIKNDYRTYFHKGLKYKKYS